MQLSVYITCLSFYLSISLILSSAWNFQTTSCLWLVQLDDEPNHNIKKRVGNHHFHPLRRWLFRVRNGVYDSIHLWFHKKNQSQHSLPPKTISAAQVHSNDSVLYGKKIFASNRNSQLKTHIKWTKKWRFWRHKGPSLSFGLNSFCIFFFVGVNCTC